MAAAPVVPTYLLDLFFWLISERGYPVSIILAQRILKHPLSFAARVSFILAQFGVPDPAKKCLRESLSEAKV